MFNSLNSGERVCGGCRAPGSVWGGRVATYAVGHTEALSMPVSVQGEDVHHMPRSYGLCLRWMLLIYSYKHMMQPYGPPAEGCAVKVKTAASGDTWQPSRVRVAPESDETHLCAPW